MPLLTTALAGEKLRIRIWETAEKAFIGLARPLQIRREGTAKAAADYQSRVALAQAEADIEEVKAGRARYDPVAGKLVPHIRPLPTPPHLSPLSPDSPQSVPLLQENAGGAIPRLGSARDFATHTLLQSTVKEMERTINLEKILQKAEAEAEGVPDTEVSDAAPDLDWMARWRESAQDVTAEQVQLMWARVLAGEVKRPGSFSLRTLDFIRSVSADEIAMIERISELVIGRAFVFRDETILEKQGVYLGMLLALESIGVISGVGRDLHRVLPSLKSEHGPAGLVHHDLGLTWKSMSKDLNLPCYFVTQLGKELLSVGKYKGKREYLRTVAQYIGQRGVRCGLGPAVSVREGVTQVDEEEWFGPTDIEEEAAPVTVDSTEH